MNIHYMWGEPEAHVTESRRLFVVDIENMVGGSSDITLASAVWARRTLEREFGLAADEHVVVAVGSSKALFPVSKAFPGKQVLLQRGVDGADLALIDSIDSEHAASRYDEVVIASGDGIFASLASMLAHYGATVTAAADPGRMSARLRFAAHHTHYFRTILPTIQKVAA